MPRLTRLGAGLLLASLLHGTAGQTRRQTCCSEDAITCAVTCTGCTPCLGCIGPQALLPWCWGCAFCIPCLTTCAQYLDCYVTPPDCTNTILWGTPPRARSWIMGTEACSAPPCALMLVMHGWTMTDDSMRDGTDMDNLAGAQRNAIVVYPDGVGVGAFSCWSIPGMVNPGQCLFDAGIDDVGFINALIDQMFSRFSIDPSRIYAVGFSNGGMMALSLACRLSHRIAAVGSVAGGPMVTAGFFGSLTVSSWACPWDTRRGSIPVMLIHGTSDTSAAYENAPGTASWFATQQGFVQIDYAYPCDGSGNSSECYYESACTSPDGHGGEDCWAGSSTEPCTCSLGKASPTGLTSHHEV